MAKPESSFPLDSSKNENLAPTQSKLTELNESRTELLSRIQSLKQDLQNWRSKLDTQVQSHRNELVELRKSLDVEVGQLRLEFQGLRTTLQQQQEDVTASLRNLGLQDPPNDAGTVTHKVNNENYDAEAIESGHPNDKTNAEESTGKGDGSEAALSSATEMGGVDINQ